MAIIAFMYSFLNFSLFTMAFFRDFLWHARRKATFRSDLYATSRYVLPPSVAGREGTDKLNPDHLEQGMPVLEDLLKWIHRELRALLKREVPKHLAARFTRVLKVCSRRSRLTTSPPLFSFHFSLFTFFYLQHAHPLCLPLENQLTLVFGRHTPHFLHELYNFMASPIDVIEYDSYAAYGPLEVVSALGLTTNHARMRMASDALEGEDPKDMIQDELHFDAFKPFFARLKIHFKLELHSN